MPVNLEQIIREKGNISGKIIEIDTFETWFNPHCALVINKVLWHALRLVVYEPTYKKLEEELAVKKITTGSLDSLKK
ncbi:MAG: hypothetical protein GBAus27B_000180 [Mycoplasmataceae bacterium]|nr:MAG: hypothetical protein GBAus27B_000180 [Mycoplasmataceae bacterium]